MQINKLVLALMLAVLAAITLLALQREGLIGILSPFKASVWTWQYFIDLALALILVMVWMWRDCVRQRKSPLPWIIGTLLTGSFAPLVYLIVREKRRRDLM